MHLNISTKWRNQKQSLSVDILIHRTADISLVSESFDAFKLLFGDLSDWEPIPFLQRLHGLEFFGFFELFQSDKVLELWPESNVKHKPSRTRSVWFGVKVFLRLIECGEIGIAFLEHAHCPRDSRRFTAWMVKQRHIATADLIANQVPNLIISDAVRSQC